MATNAPKAFVRVSTLGTRREGVSKAGNSYIMGTAFLHVSDPNTPFPQKFDYYCETMHDVLPSGEWLVPLTYEVRDGRIEFRLDTKNAQPFKEASTATAQAKS